MEISLLSSLGLDSFVSIDVESTGLDVQRDRIIEISACKYIHGELQDTFSTLINPGMKISPFLTFLESMVIPVIIGISIEGNILSINFEMVICNYFNQGCRRWFRESSTRQSNRSNFNTNFCTCFN